MLVESLQLKNFRNIRSVDTEFSAGINVIYGLNAQGKTNLLEALYMLVTSRSFRTSNDRELIPWNDSEYDGSVVRATIRKNAGVEQIAFCFNEKNKLITIDGKPISRLVHLIGKLNAVLFTPTDLLIVRGAPSLRRRFLDIAISQTNPVYLAALQDYQHILKSRNALLKKLSSNSTDYFQLDAYDDQLAHTASVIIKLRYSTLKHIARLATIHYQKIAQSKETLTLAYKPDISGDTEVNISPEAILATLQSSRQEDLRYHSTSRGPHRDDFQFLINEYAARSFASQGQQRTAVLAIKLAELDYLKSRTGETPILMLDDLMSELDNERKNALLGHLNPQNQTFITTTDHSSVTQFVRADQLIKVVNGRIG